MENKNVGYLIVGISILIIMIIFLFNSAVRDVGVATCSMDKLTCPMYESANKQTYLSLGIVGLLIIVGLVLIFSKPEERIIFKKVEAKPQKKKIDVSELNPDEKKVLALIQNNKAIFQAELIEKTGFGKVKITRIIDRLEGKGIVERKRRGMTNVVVLKD